MKWFARFFQLEDFAFRELRGHSITIEHDLAGLKDTVETLKRRMSQNNMLIGRWGNWCQQMFDRVDRLKPSPVVDKNEWIDLLNRIGRIEQALKITKTWPPQTDADAEKANDVD